jgi:leucyl-tRNA synthetase
MIAGMVQGKTYKTSNGQYVTKENILTMDKNKVVHSSTKEPLQIDWEKMSKSKYNGIDPQEIIDQYGVDFTRILMLNFVHPRSLRNFTCNYYLLKIKHRLFIKHDFIF